MPKVSIVLPVYNGEEFLSKSIESVINQTFKDWELIIVNDCSTDNSLAIAKSYAQQDGRIKIINNETNKKLPASLNAGFASASGEYYTWTSDDNEYYPEAIEKMVDFLDNNNNYGMVHAICKVAGCVEEHFWGDIATTPISLLDFPSVGACFLYKSSVAKVVGEYDTNSFYMEDHDFWLRFLLEAPIGMINDVLYFYRRHEASLTVKSNDKAARLRILLKLKYLPLYKEKFPKYKDMMIKLYGLEECIYKEDDLKYQTMKKNYKKNFLYSKLKRIYKVTKSNWQLKQIKSLGFIYFLKALKLKYRYGVEK